MRSIEQTVPSTHARDEATGLYRREFLLERIQAALHSDPDDSAAEGGVLFVKINGSSALRGRIGLSALEQLFVACGRVLVDAIGKSHLAAGINDNAYLVLATGLDDDALDALAVQVRQQLMDHSFDACDMAIRLRVSIGTCALRGGFHDANVLFDAVERTSREARVSELGIKRYVSPETTKAHREAAEVERLREAISNGSLELAHQPIVAVKGSLDAQYQSLVRWRDADGLMLTAAQILPIAERGKLMVDLDRSALSHALGVMRQQRERWRPVRLFVPQSMTTLTQPDQADWLKAEMLRQDAAGSSLLLECRLDDALLNPPALAALVEALRKVKIRLCLVQFKQDDDANRLLEAVPFAFIKLAPKYVAANTSPEVRSELIQVIDHAHQLGIQVIGPLVEDAQAAATLWISGIDFIQGNLVQAVSESLEFDFKVPVI